MKKALGLLVALLILSYPALAWLCGRVVEARISAPADATTQSAAIREDDHHLRRGWFTSDLQLTYRLDGAALPANLRAYVDTHDLSLRIEGVLHHGPVAGLDCFGAARADLHLVFDDAQRAALAKVFDNAEPVAITVCYGFLGGRRMTVTSPKVAHPLAVAGMRVESDGFRLTTRVGDRLERWSVSATLPRVTLDSPDGGHAELVGLALEGDQVRVNDAVSDGPVSLSLAKATATGAGSAGRLAVESVSIKATTTSSGGYTNAAYTFGVGPLHAASVDLREAHYDFTISHLDTAALAAMQIAARKLNGDTALSPEERARASVSLLREQAAELLTKAPELHLDRLSVDTATGKALVTGTLRAPGVTSADLATDPLTPVLLHKIEADFEVGFDESVMELLPGTPEAHRASIQHAVDEGYLARTGGHLSTQIRLRGGALSLNGKVAQQL